MSISVRTKTVKLTEKWILEDISTILTYPSTSSLMLSATLIHGLIGTVFMKNPGCVADKL